MSDFNRGLFWGIIFAWTAVVSCVFGATATKLVYLDKQQTIVVQNQSIWHNEVALSKNVEQVTDIAQEKSYFPSLDSNFALLSDIYSYNLVNIDLTYSSQYLLGSKFQFDSSVIYPNVYSKSIAKFSLVNMSDLTFLNDPDDNSHLKSLPIIIQNQTNNPKLALEISSYLQEREFQNLVIDNNDEQKSYLSQTTITTSSNSLKAANHLQDTLNFGALELTSDRNLDETSNSQIILNLGEDAKFFSHNQSFIYSAE